MPHLRPPWGATTPAIDEDFNSSGPISGTEVLEEFHEIVESLLEAALVGFREHVQLQLRQQLHNVLSKYSKNQQHNDYSLVGVVTSSATSLDEELRHSDHKRDSEASLRSAPFLNRRSSNESFFSGEVPGCSPFTHIVRDPRKSVRGSIRISNQAKADMAWQMTSSDPNIEDRPSLTHFSSETARSMRNRQSRKTMLSLYGRLASTVMSPSFEHWIGMLVILNAVAIGFNIEDRISGGSEVFGIRSESLFLSLDAVFCIIFITELVTRVLVYGRAFFTVEGWHWNVFDIFVIGCQVIEKTILICGSLAVSPMSPTILQYVRIFRGLRTLRVLHLFHEVRMIVHSIFSSATALLWTFVLLIMVIFTFSVAFVEIIMDQNQLPSLDLQHWFGSLRRTMLTLLECILSGVSWDEIVVLILAEVPPYVCMMLCVYICLGLFVILNLLTGIFVDKAMRAAREESDIHVTDAITSLFLDEEHHSNTYLTFEDFSKKIDSEAMSEYFASIGIDVGQSRALFELIDEDQSGFVDAEEIVKGCLRLRGEAKALDVVMMLREARGLKEIVEKRFAKMDTSIYDLDARLHQLSAKGMGTARGVKRENGLSAMTAIASGGGFIPDGSNPISHNGSNSVFMFSNQPSTYVSGRG